MHTQTKAICSSVALLGVWGSVQADDATLTLTTNEDLAYATGFFHFNSSVYRDDDSTRTIRDVSYGSLEVTTDPANPIVLPVTEQAGMPLNPRYAYTFMGVYDEERGLVSILLKSSVAQNAIANGLDWDEVFLPTRTGYLSESDLATNLSSFGGTQGFVYGYLDLFPQWNEPATLVNFSAATFGGTGFAAAPGAVPEPATFAALGVGALALLRRRKR